MIFFLFTYYIILCTDICFEDIKTPFRYLIVASEEILDASILINSDTYIIICMYIDPQYHPPYLDGFSLHSRHSVTVLLVGAGTVTG